VTAPAAVAHDRRSPGPGALARPLSDPIAALLRDGDTHGRYHSRSEAVMATALAAAGAGWTETAWRDVLAGSALSDWAAYQRRKGGGLRHRNPADVDHRLATTWRAAARRAAERPPVADAPSVRAELAALLAAADHNPGLWAGAAGVTDRAVLAALVDVALAACTITPSASTRQLSEAANISHSTAAVSLERLRTRGWLRLEQPAAGTLATTWRLVRPQHVQDPPAHVDEVLDALPPRPLTPAGGSARAHDAFTHTVHGGLGRVAARLFDALDDGAHGGLSVRELAALIGLHPRTVIRHLIALQAADLATSGGPTTDGAGRTWARSLTAGDPRHLQTALDTAAAVLGSTGTTARRAARHAAEREAFTNYWTDFTHRRGWAVQRGLYRPDQPALPLPLAA
jgi:DNA-binding transcriptional ArsR family regulator